MGSDSTSVDQELLIIKDDGTFESDDIHVEGKYTHGSFYEQLKSEHDPQINEKGGSRFGSIFTVMTCAVGSGVLSLRTYFDCISKLIWFLSFCV